MTASLLTRYGHTVPAEAQRWFDVADEVAAILGADALERDAANKPPFTELEILRRSGLLPLTIPARYGGAGINWSTAFEIVQRVARADNSIGQLLGYHYIFQAFPYIDLDPERGQDLADAVPGPPVALVLHRHSPGPPGHRRPHRGRLPGHRQETVRHRQPGRREDLRPGSARRR